MPSPSSSPSPSPTSMRRRPKGWARRCERCCCVAVTYLPLVFVYGLTTWAVWVESSIGFLPQKTAGIDEIEPTWVLQTNAAERQDTEPPFSASSSISSSTGPILLLSSPHQARRLATIISATPISLHTKLRRTISMISLPSP